MKFHHNDRSYRRGSRRFARGRPTPKVLPVFFCCFFCFFLFFLVFLFFLFFCCFFLFCFFWGGGVLFFYNGVRESIPGYLRKPILSYQSYTQRADDGPTPNTGWIAKCDLQGGSKSSILKEIYSFMLFHMGGFCPEHEYKRPRTINILSHATNILYFIPSLF